MPVPTRFLRVAAVCLIVGACVPALVDAFVCSPPLPNSRDNKLTLCSPESSDLSTRIVSQGLEISFPAPPRDQTTYVSDVISPVDSAWSTLPQDAVVPGLTVAGTYMGVRDQRVELAILQIGADQDSGVVGTDVIRVAWSSIFRSGVADEFELNADNAGQALPLVITDPQGGPPDTSHVAGLRITFQNGLRVRKGWSAVFDIEDFDGFHVWRWLSDPTLEARAVATYNKIANSRRPRGDWPVASPTGRTFTFLDRFVIDGNVYHYAVQSFDRGFNRGNGSTSNAGPFFGPLPPAGGLNEPGATQIRVDFLRPPPGQFSPVQAVPNPYRQSECDPTDFATTCTVRFINLPPRGTLLVYTISGDLVRTFEHPEDRVSGDAPGTLRWDTTNGAGQEIASGMYIFKIIDLESGEESFGRLGIIR